MGKQAVSFTLALGLTILLVSLSIFGCWQDYQSSKTQMLGGNPASELSILFG